MSQRIQVACPATGSEEWEATRQVFSSGWLAQGPKVEEFERALARRLGVRHAVACSSGTTALHLIFQALGIGPGDEVIVPSFTWIAVANAVVYCGAKPVLVDVDPRTYNLTPESVRGKLTPRTKGVVAVHQFGLCADLKALREAIGAVPLIEDAACAIGSESPEGQAGSSGVAASFSFHARKVVSTGEGGMVATHDDGLAEKLRSLRNHGGRAAAEPEIDMPAFDLLGFNYRMTDIQAAAGIVQLSKLDSFIEQRARWAGMYAEGLTGVKWLEPPYVPQGYRHVWQAYVCRVRPKVALKSRKEIMRSLAQAGIQTRAGTHAIHLSGFYREQFGYQETDCPVSRDLDRQTLALPMHNRLTEHDVRYVIETLQKL